MEISFKGTTEEYQAAFPQFSTALLAKVSELTASIAVLGTQQEHIMATEAENIAVLQEVSDKLDAAGATLTKIGGETTSLLAAASGLQATVADLEARLAAANVSSPAIDAAIQSLRTKVTAVFDSATAVDNLVPDAAPAPVPSA